MTEQQAIFRVLRSFARTMAGNYDTSEALHELSESVVDVLGATGTGLAVLDGGVLRFVTSTSDAAAAAEHLQERLQAGPCVESVRQNRPVALHDVREHSDEWSEYARAVEQIGFRSILGLPLVLDDRRVGSLDVYSSEPRSWDDGEIETGLVLADIGAAYVLNATELAEAERTTRQLQTALDTRVIIEQAKGVLVGRLGISPNEAFERIRSSARRQSIRVAEVSRRVIETGYEPD